LEEQRKWRLQAPKEKGVPHPTGVSQRVMCWARMTVILKEGADGETTKPETPEGKALAYLLAAQPREVETSLFRLRPKFATPHQDPERAWVWEGMLAESAAPAFREAIGVLTAFSVRFKGVNLAPQRSQDGPITMEIQTWLQKGGGKGGSKGSKIPADHDYDDDDDTEETGDDGRRHRKARRGTR
jgi:hypothetical protein